MAKRGRPTKMTPENQAEILTRIASGESMRQICLKSDHLPDMSNVFRFMWDNDDFRNKYELACNNRTEVHVEQIVEIADNDSGDTQRDRLRIDARKWCASKLVPKKYGEKLDLTPSGGSVKITIGGKAEEENTITPDEQEPDGN